MITTRTHGILDYLVGAALIAAPWLFNFSDGEAASWIPVTIGAGTIIYSLFTNYELGLFGLIPMRVHLLIDVVLGLFLAASPWLFQFAGEVWLPHFVVGLFMIGSGLMTRRVPERQALSRQSAPTVHHH